MKPGGEVDFFVICRFLGIGEDEVPGFWTFVFGEGCCWFEGEKYVKGKQRFREEAKKKNCVNKTPSSYPSPPPAAWREGGVLFPSLFSQIILV